MKTILQHATDFDWTLQGFGMLRMYFDDTYRLAVWNNKYMAKPAPALIHDHPWDFKSLVVEGKITNVIYRLMRHDTDTPGAVTMKYLEIKPGIGLSIHGDPIDCKLLETSRETYFAGDYYGQDYDMIHVTEPLDGSVTLVERKRGERPDIARSFWSPRGGWTTAESRKATRQEVKDITQHSLKLWFN